VLTESTDYTKSTGVTSGSQQSSNLSLDPIIGSALGGLAIILATVVVLVWMVYARKNYRRFNNGETVQVKPGNGHGAGSEGVPQLDGEHVKPELPGASPAAVPSMMTPSTGQQVPTALTDNNSESRHELTTGEGIY
jgi:hypothetical protein